MKQIQVLIIGGGFAGAATAIELHRQGINCLLVDTKDYFEVTFANLRNIAAHELVGNRSRKYYRDFIPCEFIQAKACELSANQLVLSNGQLIQFEHAIIATGSRYPTLKAAKTLESTSLLARNQEISQLAKSLASAQAVLVVGAGIVGVELAGEIASAYPDKKVTLAHSGTNILNSLSSKAQRLSTEQLLKLGVNIRSNCRIEHTEQGYVDTNTDQLLDADYAFFATGTKPNSELLNKHFANCLDDRGFVQVDEYLKVCGSDHLYALGDVANVGEGQLGYLAVKQGNYLAKNLAKVLKGKSVKPYKRNPLAVLIPTGQKTGVVQLPFATTSWKGLVNLKQKDLFINKMYKGFNTQPNPM